MDAHDLLDIWFRKRSLKTARHLNEPSVGLIYHRDYSVEAKLWKSSEYWYRILRNTFFLYRLEGRGPLFECCLVRPDFFEQLDRVVQFELGAKDNG